MCFLVIFVIFFEFFRRHCYPLDTENPVYFELPTLRTPDYRSLIDLDALDMDRRCCIPNCGKTRNDDTVLHAFPNPDKDRDLYLKWVNAVGLDTSLDPMYVFKNRKVCHDHFESKFLTWTRRLIPGAVPSLCLAGSNLARVPLLDITSQVENVPLDAALPSTSTITGEPSSAQKAQETRKPQKKTNEKELMKVVKKLTRKKDSYATRLKKALKLSENKTFQNILSKFTTLAAIFTAMQFREIGKNKMGRRFTEKEKIMALSLYKRSPRAYRWLQKVFILPSSMTLSRLIARANLKPGINENIFQVLKKRVATMKPDEKLCMLLFDEMSIAAHLDYNQRKDKISGFVNNGISKQKKLADHALVFMIRGIQYNYKQAIGYSFSSGTTNSAELAVLIKQMIRKLHSVGLRVLATVCDQGTSNVTALNSLIQETRSYYIRQNKELRREIFKIDNKEVIPLFDPPHLIKGIRNNLMTKDLICTMNGMKKVAKWDHIVKLYEEDTGYKGIRLIKKLSDAHLNPDNFQKMKVKYATQVLSQRVAITMGFLAEKKILPQECTHTADILLFFDELFDSVNGSFDNSKKRSGKNLLMAVTPKSPHKTIWTKAKIILKTMKFNSKQNISKTIPTVTNWLRTIENIEYLLEILMKQYKIQSLWMRHFNQDPLENFFGSIRSHGCRNNNPTAEGFESSFASLLINNLSGQYSPGSNCEDDTCKLMCESMQSMFEHVEMDPCTSESTDLDMRGSFDESIYEDYEQKKINQKVFAGLQYVTGYVLKKLKTNIFKNCTYCKNNLYDKNNKSNYDYLKIREYQKGKMYLTYPYENLVIFFSKLQDLITNILKNNPHRSNLKSFLKEKIKNKIDLSIFTCDEHKSNNIHYVINVTCNFFIFNWCKDTNKIICGKKIAQDLNDDEMKTIAQNYFNKKKHYKKK